MQKAYNVTKSKANALRTLRLRDDIIIRKAEKGNTVVILNKKDYTEEGLRQLNNGIHYVKNDKINVQETK